MSKEYSRTQRVAQEMQKKIAFILHRKIQDPRIGMATVSNVKVSRNLDYAKVFITFLDDNAKQKVKTSISTLQNAAGFIRKMLGSSMHLRIVPELIFTYDNSLIEGIRMTNLISQIVQNNSFQDKI